MGELRVFAKVMDKLNAELIEARKKVSELEDELVSKTTHFKDVTSSLYVACSILLSYM